MLRHLATSLPLVVFGALLPAGDGPDVVSPIEASAPQPPLEVQFGHPERRIIRVPNGEELVFDVFVDLGVEARAGTVELSSGAEPFSVGLPRPGMPIEASGKRTAWIESHAYGAHLGYRLDHRVRTSILPQDFPRILHTDTQTGSENRKRELKIGAEGGEELAWARKNSHCKGCDRLEHFVESNLPWGDDHHCKKCKRMEHREWREPTTREIPEGTVDLLGAIYLARTMIENGEDEIEFPMLTSLDLWTVTLRRGGEKTKSSSAGKFSCTKIVLATEVPEGEDADEEDFKGLFGMHGDIAIWVETSTGIPVVIEGKVPIGPLDLGVSVRLREFSGTPPEFVGR